MLRSFIMLTLAVAAVNYAAAVEIQNFGSATFAASRGWAVQNGTTGSNNFGFQPTNLALGASGAGEGGGAFQRPGNIGYYSDLDLDGSFDVTTSLTASGRIRLSATASPASDEQVVLGFWNQLNTSVSGAGPHNLDNFIGIRIEPNLTVMANAFGGDYEGYNGSGGDANAIRQQVLAANNYDFTLTYTAGGFPLGGGEFNYGELTAVFTPVGGGPSVTLRNALNPAQNHLGRPLNAFGLLHVNSTSDANNAMTLLIDDLSYTSNFVAPVPEPSTFLLTIGGGLALVYRARRKSSR